MSRIDDEQEIITGIAEVLTRERPGTTVPQNWADAVDLHRVVYETRILPAPEEVD